jgi:capsular exopolysaccharide synthesis family protein
MAPESESKQEEFRLPLELKTVLKTLRLKLVWIFVIGVAACAIGLVAALLLGTQKYESTTVLFYQPIESYVPDTFRIYQTVGEGTELTYEQGAGLIKFESPDTSLWNRVNMVKTLPNLEQLRMDLALERTLESLGSAIKVTVARDTNLMFISASSDNPEEAKLIANTIRDIFLANNNSMIGKDLQDRLKNLEQQFNEAQGELQAARTEFAEYIEKYNIRDITIEAPKYAGELVDLELTLDKNKQQIEIYKQRVIKIKEAIVTANLLVEEEQKQLEEETQELGITPDEANNKIQQLIQRIDELRARSTNPVEQERLRTQLAIAENEYVRGLISRSEFESARFEYEFFIAQNSYSEEIELLKQQVDEIRSMTFVGRGDSVASSEYLKLIRVLLLENELELIKTELQYAIDLERYTFLKENYVDMPVIVQNYIVLTGRVASLEAETRGLEKILNQYRMISAKEHSDFYIISDAVTPLYPQESNKKLIAIAVAFLVFLIAFTILLARIVMDQRIKSAGDAKQKLNKPILGSFPFVKYNQVLLPDGSKESQQIELYRILARPLRLKYPKRGATFLITSTTQGEGKSTTAINLATVFGRQDEHVLLLDAQIRKTETASPFITFCQPLETDTEHSKGLGEYLSYKVFDIQEIITHSTLPGVDMIVKHDEAVIPDLLQSARMRELMEELKELYTIIIIEGPPVLECVDTEILTNYADTIIYITACDAMKPTIIQRSLKRLQNTEIPLEGIVLTKISPVYIE